MSRIDPITTEVIAQSLHNAAVEAGVVLIRSAYSPNIKERHDCSTAIFDRVGRIIAQAHHIPIHLGSMIGAIDALTALHPLAQMQPGDMFAANDPYSGGGSHLPDISVIAPVFVNNEVVAFVANIAHHADVGGMVPGSEAAACTSIFQEGLRLPPVRLVAADELCQDIANIVLLNSRTPDERAGDLRAQIASNRSAGKNVQAIYARFGGTVATAMDAVLDSTERRFANAIGKLANGVYDATEYLSGDTPDTRAQICVRLSVADETLSFDLNGTSPALKTARNIPHQALLATVYTVAKALLDPHVPANAGYFRTIHCSAARGSLVYPEPPAPVGARSISCGVLSDAIVAVMSAARPEIGLAPSGPHHLLNWSGRDPRNGRYFVNYETVAGGLGAFADRDGMDAVRTLASGSANLPVEALEHAYPLRIERYALRDGSGGDGQFHGGRGIVRDYRVLGEGVTVSLSAERQHEPARGVAGGADGQVGRFIANSESDASTEHFSGAQEVALEHGATFRVLTPGGAGRGAACDRKNESK
jgi:N-methylhydantoinase B